MWSPDGKWIYFTHLGDSTIFLYRLKEDGSDLQQLHNTAIGGLSSSLSSDGEWIVFSDSINIYKMRSDGSEIQPLTTSDSNDLFPIWSHDGKHIAFTSNLSGNFDIFMMRSDGSEVEQVVSDTNDNKQPLLFSPDGQWLVYRWMGEAACTDSIELQTRQIQQLGCSVSLQNASWSPDGKWLVLDSNINTNSNSTIYITQVDGTARRTLVSDQNYWSTSPTWSPAIDLAWSRWKMALVSVSLLAMMGIWEYRSIK